MSVMLMKNLRLTGNKYVDRVREFLKGQKY